MASGTGRSHAVGQRYWSIVMRRKFKLGIFALLGSILTPSLLLAQILEPTNMGPVINSAARDAEPTFTADGQTM